MTTYFMTACVHFIVHNIYQHNAVQQTKREEKGCDVSGTLSLRYPLPGFAITIAETGNNYGKMYWNQVDGAFCASLAGGALLSCFPVCFK